MQRVETRRELVQELHSLREQRTPHASEEESQALEAKIVAIEDALWGPYYT